jgi:pre-mRNA-splicing factor CDC5/CEF1
MTAAQTPLLGEENTPLHVPANGGTGFEGATPRHQIAFTPNPLADVTATPRDAATPLRTPLRDNLSINAEGFPSIPSTPRDQKLRSNASKRALQLGFANLPKPENNFELVVPEDEEEEEPAESPSEEEDAAERDARLKRIREEEERKALARRSQAVQQNLPRPANVDVAAMMERLNVVDDAASQLIDEELVELMHHDAIAYPLPGTTNPGSTISAYEMPSDDDIATAKQIIHLELAAAVGFQNTTPEQLKEGLQAIAKANASEELDSMTWDTLRQTLAFDADSKTWVEAGALSLDQRIGGYTSLLTEKRDEMTKEANKVAKAEKKLSVTLGGYQARSQVLSKRIVAAFEEMEKAQLEYDSFGRLRAMESAAGPRRVASLKEEVDVLERREKLLQRRYGELESEKREAEARIAALEEKVMAEAEALNEVQLAAMES